MSQLDAGQDDDPSFHREVDPSVEEFSIPTVLTIRIASLALIGGKPHGIVVDIALGGSLLVPKDCDPRDGWSRSGMRKSSPALEVYRVVHREMAFRFELALSKHRRDAGMDGFHLDAVKVDCDQIDFMMGASGRRAFVLPFCAVVEDRVWSLWDRMDESHPSYGSQGQARDAFVAMAVAAAKAMAKHGPAEAGLALDDAAPLALEFQASPESPPTTPAIPFSKVVGQWGQSEPLWAPMVDSLIAMREAKDLAASLGASPAMAPRKAPASL